MTSFKEYEKEARKLGSESGKAAATWYFDGNTDQETYSRVLKGIEDVDPEILDTFPANPLSGEWADGLTPTLLMDLLGFSGKPDTAEVEGEVDELCSVFEEAYSEAALDEIERVARYQTKEEE